MLIVAPLFESPLAALKLKSSNLSDKFTKTMIDNPKLARAIGTSVRTIGNVVDATLPTGLLPGGVAQHTKNYDTMYGNGLHPKTAEDSTSMSFGEKMRERLSPERANQFAKMSAAVEGGIRGSVPIMTPLTDKIRRFRAGLIDDKSIIHEPGREYQLGRYLPVAVRAVRGAF